MARTTPRRRRRGIGPGLAFALIALGAAIAWWWLGNRGLPWLPGCAPDEAPGEAPIAATAPGAEPEPVEPPAAAPEAPVPPLDESDPFVRDLVAPLSDRPALATWLAQADLVRLFVVSTDNVAEGRSPRGHLGFLRPAEPFSVLGEGEQLRIDPASYARYDAIADVVDSLHAPAVVAVYEKLRPLLEAAYRELGYPDAVVEGRLLEALDELIATPVIGAEPRLDEHIGRYVFADPELERLSAARKQLLRMGPRNVERVTAKLREIRAALSNVPAGAPTGPAEPAEGGEWDDG